MSKIQICRIFWVEHGPHILYHVHGRVFIVEIVSPNLGSIRKFLGSFFLMDTHFSQVLAAQTRVVGTPHLQSCHFAAASFIPSGQSFLLLKAPPKHYTQLLGWCNLITCIGNSWKPSWKPYQRSRRDEETL